MTPEGRARLTSWFEIDREIDEEVMEALLTLLWSERKARMVRLRFGLDGGGQKTLREVGQAFSVSASRSGELLRHANRLLRWYCDQFSASDVSASAALAAIQRCKEERETEREVEAKAKAAKATETLLNGIASLERRVERLSAERERALERLAALRKQLASAS